MSIVGLFRKLCSFIEHTFNTQQSTVFQQRKTDVDVALCVAVSKDSLYTHIMGLGLGIGLS